MTAALVIIGGFTVVYALAAGRLSRTILTGPMLFTAFGLLIGPHGTDLVDLSLGNDSTKGLLNATLAVVLFVDASRVNPVSLRRDLAPCVRLLAIGLPVMILAGVGAAKVIFPHLEVVALIAIATVLAPTDAALGQAVVRNPRVPASARRILTVESGLNDGLALPVLISVLALGKAHDAGDPLAVFLTTMIRELGLGLAVGVIVGGTAGYLIRRSKRSGWAPPSTLGIALLGTLAVAYSVADGLHGSALIAAFVAGLATGPFVQDLGEELFAFGEDLVTVLTLLAFVVFGGSILSKQLTAVSWQILLYAVVTLMVLRPLATTVASLGTRAAPATVLFFGWFGPRGIASVLFVFVILEKDPGLAGLDIVAAVMAWTVLLSIVLHGITAWPGSNAYADWCTRNPARNGGPGHNPARTRDR